MKCNLCDNEVKELEGGLCNVCLEKGVTVELDEPIAKSSVDCRVIKKNGGQELFEFMTAELINDEDLQYGNRVRKYWLITCEDWRDTEVEKKFILDARSFPEGTTITLKIPEGKLKL